MFHRVGSAARRALILVPLLGTAASAQSLGGLTLRGTGGGFNIVDNAAVSTSLNISGYTQVIGPSATNQTVVVRLNNLRHTWGSDLRGELNFVSADLSTNLTWRFMNRPGFFAQTGNNFGGSYSFGEYDDPSSSFVNDLDTELALSLVGVAASGDYYGFNSQDLTSPGAIFSGFNPNGTWRLTISDFVTLDQGSLESWDLAFNLAPSTTVPEPSTYALMAAGLVALGAVARRRRSR